MMSVFDLNVAVHCHNQPVRGRVCQLACMISDHCADPPIIHRDARPSSDLIIIIIIIRPLRDLISAE